MRFVDSHLHLDGPEAPSLMKVARANQTLLLGCGIDRMTSTATLRLARSDPQTVRAFVGVHPSEALKEGSLIWLEKALEAASGLGEVGLDPKYSPTREGSAQSKVLLSQLFEAQNQKKPVQIHSRDAEVLCMDTLSSFNLKEVLMHWYQGEQSLSTVMEKGYFVSFGPALIYSKKLQRMAARCDPSRVLTETDSPIPYGPLRGAYGASLVPSVVFRLAEIWGMGFEDVRVALVENVMRFLGTRGKG